jgi:hypothetical protein
MTDGRLGAAPGDRLTISSAGGPDSDDAQVERHESEAERIDRNLAELLQEIRVAIIGAQVLFGFLLAIPFTTRFDSLTDTQQALFTGDLLLAALATVVLVGPVALHRLRFRRHQKARILGAANTAAIAGLIAIGAATTGSVLLVMDVVWGGPLEWALTLPIVAAIVGVWFVIPASRDRPDTY